MVAQKKIKTEWIIITVLVVILAVVIIFFYYKSLNQKSGLNNSDLEQTPHEQALNNYRELEAAYDKALAEIETTIEKEGEDMNLAILRENLTKILEDIKKEKQQLTEKHGEILEGDSLLNPDRTEQYKDMLAMSKEVLIEKLAQSEARNRDLEELSKDLQSNNQKLKENLDQANKYFEKEKLKNANLNEQLGNVSEQIKMLEKSGNEAKGELQVLQREKKEYEQRLKESNEALEFQNFQIKNMGEILRKINIDCYFIYEQGNVEEEAKIYLTSEGISERYLRYFLRVKPNILVDFMVNKDVFSDGSEKIELSVLNQNKSEIYSIPKSIKDEKFHVVIPNKNFNTGTYYIKLRSGDEDLIIGNEYKFKIGVN